MTDVGLFMGDDTPGLCPIYPPGVVAWRQTQSKLAQPTRSNVTTAQLQAERGPPTGSMRLSTVAAMVAQAC